MKTTKKAVALVSLDGLPSIRIDATILLIGRSSECDVVVDSKKVSRKHCCLALVGEYVVVKDLGSTNGCRLNGDRRDECRVEIGEELTIADLNYRLEWDDGQVRPPRQIKPTDSAIERADRPLLIPDDDVSPAPMPPAPRKVEPSDSCYPIASGLA